MQNSEDVGLQLHRVEVSEGERSKPPIQAAEQPDAELAKRPWLLEKLVGKEAEPSVKTNPPEPPTDPPSAGRLYPPEKQLHSPANQLESHKNSQRDVSKNRQLDDVSVEEVPPSKLRKENETERPGQSAYVSDLPPEIARDYTGFPEEPIRLTRSVYQMRNQMRHTLRSYYSDIEIANQRSNWGMMHAIMVYGIDTKIRVGRKSYSAIAWIAGNNACRGQKLLKQKNGELQVKSGVGLQGHQAQMLAIFSLCGVPSDYPVYADDKKFSVADVIELEKLDCKSGEELTFSLIGLSHYLDTDAVWKNRLGEVWNFERLIQEELSQPIVGAACGGTHRLMGFAHALRKRRAEGKPITGQWKRADQFTKDFVKYAYRLQNRDGSFSTDWFEGRENNGNLDRQIQTTGHIVEWLLTVTPNQDLQNPRLVSAVRFLLRSMYGERKHDWSIGPKGHALRSLAMYYDRVYQTTPPWRQNAQTAHRKDRSHR